MQSQKKEKKRSIISYLHTHIVQNARMTTKKTAVHECYEMKMKMMKRRKKRLRKKVHDKPKHSDHTHTNHSHTSIIWI